MIAEALSWPEVECRPGVNVEKEPRHRIDSHAAVSNARSMRKSCADGTYKEMIENSPFRIRSAWEILDVTEITWFVGG